jgi:hypothetical protein
MSIAATKLFRLRGLIQQEVLKINLALLKPVLFPFLLNILLNIFLILCSQLHVCGPIVQTLH